MAWSSSILFARVHKRIRPSYPSKAYLSWKLWWKLWEKCLDSDRWSFYLFGIACVSSIWHKYFSKKNSLFSRGLRGRKWSGFFARWKPNLIFVPYNWYFDRNASLRTEHLILENRWRNESVIREFLFDLTNLINAKNFVGTFSSNIGRVVFQLFAVKYVNPEKHVLSLDETWYGGLWRAV